MDPWYAEQYRRRKETKYPWKNNYSIEACRILRSEADSDAIKTNQPLPKKYKDMPRIEKPSEKRKLPRTVHSCSSSIGQRFKYLNDEYEQELGLTKTSSLLINAGILLPKPSPSITNRVDLLGRSTSKPFIDMPIQYPNTTQSLKNLRANRSKYMIVIPIQQKPDLPSASEMEEGDEPWST